MEVRRTKLTASETKLTHVNDQAIRRVLEGAGVEFIDAMVTWPGRAIGTPNGRKDKLGVERHARLAIATVHLRAGIEFIDEHGGARACAAMAAGKRASGNSQRNYAVARHFDHPQERREHMMLRGLALAMSPTASNHDC